MQLYYSASENGFFDDGVHSKLPKDAVNISEELHKKIIVGQREGMIITSTPSGRPTLKTLAQIDPKKALIEAKDYQKSLITMWRDNALAGGVEYEGEIYQAEANSYNMLSGVIAAIAAGLFLPDGFVWRTIDNKNITMTADTLKALGQIMFEYVEQCHHKAWTLKDAVNQATTIDAVQSITWQ